VLNRVAEVPPARVADLAARLAAAPPWPRPVLATADGTLPLGEVLRALDAADAGPGSAGPAVPRGADPAVASAGWRWPAAVAFDRARLSAALDALAAPGGPLRACGLLRGKGVFRTERAWYAWQWVDGRSDLRESAWRADSRLEVLAERRFDPQVVDQAVRAAVRKG
jgi:hypothetical protein